MGYNGDMDKYVKQSIEARRNALSASYIIDAGMQKKVEALFAEIEKLGAGCKDAADFEAQFAASPLNQGYLDLFTEVATKCQAQVAGDAQAAPKASAKEVGKMVAAGTAVGVAEGAAEQAMRQVVPTRATVHQAAYDEVRKVPGLGDAIDIGQKAGYVRHLAKVFGGRRKKKEKE